MNTIIDPATYNKWELGHPDYAGLTERIAQALEYVSISPEERESVLRVLRAPECATRVDLPLPFGNYIGWRVQHCSALGPYKGGMRFHAAVDQQLLGLLALMMTLKNSYLGLPLGGAKGGICVDPLSLDPKQLELLTRKFAYGLRYVIGPERDIPAPDVGTDGRIMSWITDTYRITHGGMLVPAVVTGKPTYLGGIPGKGRSTGRGVAHIIRLAAEYFGRPLRTGTTVAIEGFGNVGSVTAEALAEMGCQIVAVSDVGGTLYNEQGLDITRLMTWAAERRGSIQGFPGGETIPRAELLLLPVDVLSPCALEGSVNLTNAHRIQAHLVAGGANKYATDDAVEILMERGVPYVDDRMTNGGGVVYSHAEWVQNREGMQWPERDTLQTMYGTLERSWLRTLEIQHRLGVPLHVAADVVTVEPLAMAMLTRGDFL